jgi:DNA-binding NarL/FixJ family response regulator
MRVAVAEDSGLVRQALTALLEQGNNEVTISASSADELLAYVRDNPPDVALIDLRMPPTFTDEGVVAARTIKAWHPTTGALVLSSYNETPQAMRLLDGDPRGVGYLLKDQVSDVTALQEALDRVRRGETVVDPQVVSRLISARQRSTELDELTDRDREVLGLVAEGYTNEGIAKRLVVSRRTVEDYVQNIFRKLRLGEDGEDVNKRVKATLMWLRVTGGAGT